MLPIRYDNEIVKCFDHTVADMLEVCSLRVLHNLLNPIIKLPINELVIILKPHYHLLLMFMWFIIRALHDSETVTASSFLWRQSDERLSYCGIFDKNYKSYKLIITYITFEYVKGTSHATLLLYYPRTKLAYSLDPESDTLWVEDKLKQCIARFFLSKSIKVSKIIRLDYNFIQREGARQKSVYTQHHDPHGYCTLWSLLLTHIFLLYPNKDPTVVPNVLHDIIAKHNKQGSFTIFARQYYINWVKILNRVIEIGFLSGYGTLYYFVAGADVNMLRCCADKTCHNKIKKSIMAYKRDAGMFKGDILNIANTGLDLTMLESLPDSTEIDNKHGKKRPSAKV
jgi:hypothetical protein